MDHGNPRIKRACVVHVLHAGRTVVVTKFLDHLTDRHLKLSVKRADSALCIGRNAVFATGQRVMVDDVVEVWKHDAGGGSECSQLLVHHVQTAVCVRLLEHQLHSLGHII